MSQLYSPRLSLAHNRIRRGIRPIWSPERGTLSLRSVGKMYELVSNGINRLDKRIAELTRQRAFPRWR